MVKEAQAPKQLAIGDVVSLNSNDKIAMTVEHVDGEAINCVWIDEAGTLKRMVFKRAMLSAA